MNKAISWWVPKIGSSEYKYIKEVLELGYPNEGELTKKFEAKIKELVNAKFAVSTTSGTAALFLALKALGIRHGDEVLVPDLTFIASANAVHMTGATPLLVDVNPSTGLFDEQQIEKNITSKTKALMPVHISGRACDMLAINTLAKKYNLFVVEDAAEAFMSQYKGKYLGTWGDVGCFSFSPFKIITTGQGGIVVTNNEDTYKKLLLLKDHGRPVRGTGGDDIHYSIGYNFKLTNLQSAVGLGQLEQLQDRINRSKEIYSYYKNLIDGKDIPIKLFNFDIKNGELPLWVDAYSDQRDELQKYLKEQGIDCRNFWYPLHTQQPYKKGDAHYFNTVSLAKKSFWLPSHFLLSNEDIERVGSTILRFFSRELPKNITYSYSQI